MKRKIGLIFAVIMLASLLAAVFAFTASAEEAINVTYNWHSGGVWETAMPNGDGSYTLRIDKKSGDGTVTLTDGTVVDKEFFGWYDEEGNMYAPGATVTFTKSTRLYEAYGITVSNADDLHKMNEWKDSTYVKLGADITTNKALGNNWCTRIIDMNGYSITSTSNESAISVTRGAVIILGEGKFTHAPEKVSTSIDKGFIWFSAHGYGDQDHPQLCWIGKDVEVETPYSLLYVNNVAREKHPNMVIAGKVTARTLARINCSIVDARCYIADSAEVTVTSDLLEFKNTTGTAMYMTLTLNGTINVANGEGTIFTDFVMSKLDVVFNGGKYCVSEGDITNIKYFLPDTLMAKTVVDGDLTWYDIVPSDCVHKFVLNTEETILPTTTSTGVDVFDCDVCGTRKMAITVYNPSNDEISIVVRDSNGEDKSVLVKVGDVLVLESQGVGENTKFSLVAVKGTEEYAVESIVAVEIPFGISLIAVANANETLETINIMDGASLEVGNLTGLTGLKTINIGAATVKFCSVGTNASLENIKSDVAGANVTFARNCFSGKSNIKVLTMANGSSYAFDENSFRLTSVETVIFPDEATVSFTGGAAFYNATTKYAYFGNSITKINNKPFDCANNLELVVIKAATYIDQYCFCVAGANNSTAVLKVYCHSLDVSIHQNAFVNRQNNGVEFYTIDPDITSLSGCTYTVYNGIPHAYAQGIVKESTCIEHGIEGSTTDCVCGVNEVVTYTIYTAGGSEVRSTEQRELPLSDVHVLGTVLSDIKYKNGYMETGTKEYYCALCNTATVEEPKPSAEPLIDCQGYSVCTFDGSMSITQGYAINIAAFDACKAVVPGLAYGLVVAPNLTAQATKPLKVENGDVVKNNENASLRRISTNVNCYIDIKIKGISEATSNKCIIFCLYVFDGTNIQYIDNGVCSDSVVGTTFNANCK